MRAHISWVLIALLTLAVLAPRPGWAQVTGIDTGESTEPVDEQQPNVIELTVLPRATPKFALEYRLLPTYSEKTSGNAAQFYYRALLQRKSVASVSDKQYTDNYEQWMQWPPDEKALAEMKEWLKAYQGAVFGEMKVAVYREYCDWDYRMRDMKDMEAIAFLLEEIQESRSLARALQIQLRVQMMEGKTDEAFETLRTGFQMARDVAQPPTLINALVGVAIANIMTNELQHFLTLDDSPNLYWAISALPVPLFDLRTSMEQEMGFLHQVFPFVKDAETAERSPEQWRTLLVESLSRMGDLAGGDAGSWRAELGITALAALAYPRAKQELVKAGFAAEKVEAMSVPQVVAIQTARVTRYAYHETFKWSFLPYSEAQGHIEREFEKLKEEGVLDNDVIGRHGALPFANLLLPSVGAASYAPVRLQRQIAVWRIIEALRDYAADHNGQLPDSLADITELPVPVDPLNNQPISYRRDGDRAVLDLPARPGHLPMHEGYRYIVRIRAR